MTESKVDFQIKDKKKADVNMQEESKQDSAAQFGVSYEAKSTGISKVHDISWKCRYCKAAMSEGKLFGHEATCTSKPKVKM